MNKMTMPSSIAKSILQLKGMEFSTDSKGSNQFNAPLVSCSAQKPLRNR